MVDEASLGFDPVRYELELNRRNVSPSNMDQEGLFSPLIYRIYIYMYIRITF